MNALIVIPARLASTRLPRKLLLRETGMPLIAHTYEAARSSQLATRVIVAADDPEIVDAVVNFGGEAILTDVRHACGTDRISEAIQHFPDHDLIVNVQGDEPELAGSAIDLALSVFNECPEAQMATLATPIRDKAVLDSPNCVKVVVDSRNRALYFSRSPIPYPRDWQDSLLARQPACFLQHLGLYVYRREFLLKISKAAPAPCELIESLEQLRVLHLGESIHVRFVEHAVRGIDTAEDYRAFVRRSGKR